MDVKLQLDELFHLHMLLELGLFLSGLFIICILFLIFIYHFSIVPILTVINLLLVNHLCQILSILIRYSNVLALRTFSLLFHHLLLIDLLH